MSKKTLNVVLGVVAILVVCLIGLFLFIPKGSSTPAFSTPTGQKTDPMPSGSVSTDPTTPPVSVPPEPNPTSTPPAGNSSYENTYQQLPDGTWPNPFEEYLIDWETAHIPRESIFGFYPANKEMAITMAPGAEDIVSYAENLGWQQYTGDDNINFYYGADSWESPDVISRVSYIAPQGFFVIYYRTTAGYHEVFYTYMGWARDTIDNNVFSTELADCMKSLLDKMTVAGIVEHTQSAMGEVWEPLVFDYGDHYSISITPELTVIGTDISYNSR